MSELEVKVERLCGLVESLLAAYRPTIGLLTVEQVAKQLGIATKTVYDLATCGRLPHVRIGKGRGTLRFDPAQVRHYLKMAAL